MYRILIMEKNPAVRTRIIQALDDDAFRITDISEYLMALSFVDVYPPDLAIVGEELLNLSGWDVCRWLCQSLKIPVILIGTGPADTAWGKVIESGADFYFKVPFKVPELSARVRAILCRYQLTT